MQNSFNFKAGGTYRNRRAFIRLKFVANITEIHSFDLQQRVLDRDAVILTQDDLLKLKDYFEELGTPPTPHI